MEGCRRCSVRPLDAVARTRVVAGDQGDVRFDLPDRRFSWDDEPPVTEVHGSWDSKTRGLDGCRSVAGPWNVMDNILYMDVLTKHSETSQIDVCLRRLFLLNRYVDILEAFS